MHFTGGADGGNSYAGVIRDQAGNLYGTTSSGGADSVGNLYGTTSAGSMFNYGTVFKLDAKGHETILHNFRSDPDGAAPYAAVIGDASGNLYGTTLLGGSYNSGVVYELAATGKEPVLHTFAGSDGLEIDAAGNETVPFSITGHDGLGPYGGVVHDSAGNLYGTTANGGTENAGVVYKIAP